MQPNPCGMTVAMLIDELKRFDGSVLVTVEAPEGRSAAVVDVGRRDRPALGVHPKIYLGALLDV
jgi:hypothetical protein